MEIDFVQSAIAEIKLCLTKSRGDILNSEWTLRYIFGAMAVYSNLYVRIEGAERTESLLLTFKELLKTMKFMLVRAGMGRNVEIHFLHWDMDFKRTVSTTCVQVVPKRLDTEISYPETSKDRY